MFHFTERNEINKHNVFVYSLSDGNVREYYMPHAFYVLHFPHCHIFFTSTK
jgi:hypothetical protein